MARQFWVGEFFVDLSRNQISQLGQSQTLPPKALQVLLLLAKNPGEVVTYDELLKAVWPPRSSHPIRCSAAYCNYVKLWEKPAKNKALSKTTQSKAIALSVPFRGLKNLWTVSN